MADPSFFVKVGIECGIGIGTKCAAEAEKRKGRFAKELDFVTANVIMAIIADFMLVWLPAPTMSFATAQSCRVPRNAMARFFSCCPDNAFQKVPEGAASPGDLSAMSYSACCYHSKLAVRRDGTVTHEARTHARRLGASELRSAVPEGDCCAGFPSWSLAQRVAAPIRNGGKLLVVGFSASMFGVLITNLLCWVREQVSGGCQQSNPQNPLTVSAAYATYMATSSNMRYQVVAGVLEERGIEVRVARSLLATNAAGVLMLAVSRTLSGHLHRDAECMPACRPSLRANPRCATRCRSCCGQPTPSWGACGGWTLCASWAYNQRARRTTRRRGTSGAKPCVYFSSACILAIAGLSGHPQPCGLFFPCHVCAPGLQRPRQAQRSTSCRWRQHRLAAHTHRGLEGPRARWRMRGWLDLAAVQLIMSAR